MKALQLTDQGDDTIILNEIDKPEPNANEVLVQVKAAALNHRDQWCREGKYPALKVGVTLGSDGAGIVVGLGKNVSNNWLNQEVIINPNIDWGDNPLVQSANYHILGMPSDGTFAEYLVINENRLALKPKHLTFEQAAAIPLAGMTAYRALMIKGGYQDSFKVLVTGIGGGVSQSAAMILSALGGNYYVTSGSEEKIEKAKTLGAKGGFNYKDKGWWKDALKVTGGFDLIIDSAGGNHVNTYLKVIKSAGKIVFYGSTAGAPESVDMFRLFWSQASLIGSTMANDDEFTAMIKLVTENKINPIVDSIRPFDEIVNAFNDMRDAKQFGKLVIKMD